MSHDLIRMAREAGFEVNFDIGAVSVDGAHINRELQRFAALVAAKHCEAMRMALEALRTSQPYVAHYCKESIVTPHNEAINELKRALGGKR